LDEDFNWKLDGKGYDKAQLERLKISSSYGFFFEKKPE
jgi:hypothetical protein